MTLSPDATAWLFALQAIQLALGVGLLLLLRRLGHRSGTGDAASIVRPVVAELAAPLTRLAQQLETERQRLTELTERANRLVTNLAGANSGSAAETVTARDEARRRLQAGEPLEAVVEATGLPSGEVEILANLLQARGTEAETLKAPRSAPIDS